MNRASSATGWVRNPDGTLGWTWNPITGCLNGCEYCYARKLANGRLKSRYLNGGIFSTSLEFHTRYPGCLLDPFYPRLWEDRLQDLFHRGETQKPRGIFVCDMSDLFGKGIPEKWTQKVMDAIKLCPQHRFYLLTKQPQNLPQFSPFPDNCWVGATITTREMAHHTNFYLPGIEAKVKYISFEPLLDDVMQYLYCYTLIKSVNWVIIGAQTNPRKPPSKIWVDEIIEACKKAGIPYFLKDNLKPLLGDNLIQDMPKGVEIVH